MTAEIFPGLPEPKSQLYFDLQAMIAENGGRNKFADTLEAEMVKPYSYKYKNFHSRWSSEDINLLFENYHKYSGEYLAKLIGKPSTAVNAKIHVLLQRGLLKGKYKPYTKNEH